MGELAWLLLVLVVLSGLGDWAAAGAIERQWRQEPIDHQRFPVSIFSWACWASSLPRFQVSERHSCAGRPVICSASAAHIASAP